ncbi:MAG TPA: isoleucine--tRNA ligase, partial [Tepidiformaceae bacterium]|nr:isoleucine--tRNA ligase [Tepidiformaceae bacterium]
MFKPVDPRVNFPKLEEGILAFWQRNAIFRRSVEERPEDNLFVFYEGPPTANARPGIHHVLSRVFKDLIPRYKTMQGYRVPRKGGWDTHGLPVELEIEKELGLKSKPEIEAYGIAAFNAKCKESVSRYVEEWTRLSERIAYWADYDDPYVTWHNSYIESGWWLLKQMWDHGLVYQDYRVGPYCPRCGTSLSDHEVSLGYQDDTPDPSVFPKFRVLSSEFLAATGVDAAFDGPLSLVAWTTTPWTLPANVALAVNPEATYGLYEHEGEHYVVAAALAEKVLGERSSHIASFPGTALVGLKYEPLYRPELLGQPVMRFDPEGRLRPVAGSGEDFDRATSGLRRVIAADYVSLDDGTGIVHNATSFGGEDFEEGKSHGLLFVQPVDLRGIMAPGLPGAGKFVKQADADVIRDLESRGLMLKHGTIKHTYPFCWRCGTPLLYYAKPSWYIRTTKQKAALLEGNSRINWYPEHIKNGRFGNWLENNIDWAVSRERYWGSPLPIWVCESCGESSCIGSRAELIERALEPAKAEALDDLHRPFIDDILLRCDDCGGTARRIPEVADAWYDSGAMPYAQWHYPFENQDEFLRNFPADFICEAIDQTRGWFYTLHAEATLLAASEAVPDSIAFRNVICLGHINDEKGNKMSKSKGNTVSPWEVLDAHGADATRWYMYTASPAGSSRRFSLGLVEEGLRRFLLTLWNTYSFFVSYANIDNADPRVAPPADAVPELDRWLLSELNALVLKVTEELEAYDPTDAARAIETFVDDLSNWYVRRSRRRFWRGASESDTDKQSAYHTLYTALVTVSKLLAPFTPFIAEELYQNLVCSIDAAAPASVHLAQWPTADRSKIDDSLNAETQLVKRICSLGRAARAKAQIK